MKRRTIPRAGTRKRHAYYDWDQRPCTLTSFAQTVVQQTVWMQLLPETTFSWIV